MQRLFEHRSEELLPTRHFLRRLVRFSAVSIGIGGTSLALGTAGYHCLAGLGWVDALLNAAMIFTGMGPVDHVEIVAGKLFATAYALFSAVALPSTVGVLVAPIVHRFFHALHVEVDQDEGKDPKGTR